MGIFPTLPNRDYIPDDIKMPIGSLLYDKKKDDFLIIVSHDGNGDYNKENGKEITAYGGWGYCKVHEIYYQKAHKYDIRLKFEPDRFEVIIRNDESNKTG